MLNAQVMENFQHLPTENIYYRQRLCESSVTGEKFCQFHLFNV